jgi:hypothetical protein
MIFDILLILVFIVVPVAALCMQTIPLRLGNVTFHDTDLEHAWLIVAQYARGTFEQRFGYPTGYFTLEEKRSQRPARIVMKEAQPVGAVTDGCSLQLGQLSMAGFDEGCGAGCLWLCAVAFIGAPFFLVSTFDRFFRFMLRSRVDVQLHAAGPDAVASFAFYGPGGYSLRRRYAQVFERPVLPAALTMDPAMSAGERPAPDRPGGPDRPQGPSRPQGPGHRRPPAHRQAPGNAA